MFSSPPLPCFFHFPVTLFVSYSSFPRFLSLALSLQSFCLSLFTYSLFLFLFLFITQVMSFTVYLRLSVVVSVCLSVCLFLAFAISGTRIAFDPYHSVCVGYVCLLLYVCACLCNCYLSLSVCVCLSLSLFQCQFLCPSICQFSCLYCNSSWPSLLQQCWTSTMSENCSAMLSPNYPFQLLQIIASAIAAMIRNRLTTNPLVIAFGLTSFITLRYA